MFVNRAYRYLWGRVIRKVNKKKREKVRSLNSFFDEFFGFVVRSFHYLCSDD